MSKRDDEHKSCRERLGLAWSHYLNYIMDDTDGDGISMLELVLQENPDLRRRLELALTGDTSE